MSFDTAEIGDPMAFKTSPVEFWKGDFGNGYIDRNDTVFLRAAYIAMWSRILAKMGRIDTVLEVGANIGMNLDALDILVPGIKTGAVEPNPKAAENLRRDGRNVWEGTAEDPWEFYEGFDLVFTRGVLIHIDPDKRKAVYRNMIEASLRYILVVEYYNPVQVMVPYRGENDKLWKADFAGELMAEYPLDLIDYGFISKHDPVFPQDDVTWFLLEKRA